MPLPITHPHGYLRDLLLAACVRAEAATLFTALDVDLLFNNLDALEATAFDVFSLRDMIEFSFMRFCITHNNSANMRLSET